ncbi:MAG: hypothetical protein WBQ73_00215 [Candidatus Babeliales bacterium]
MFYLRKKRLPGFFLLDILASMTILSVIMLLLSYYVVYVERMYIALEKGNIHIESIEEELEVLRDHNQVEEVVVHNNYDRASCYEEWCLERPRIMPDMEDVDWEIVVKVLQPVKLSSRVASGEPVYSFYTIGIREE